MEPQTDVQPQLGGRRLGIIHVVGQALAVGPVYSAGIVLYVVASAAGGATPGAVVLATLFGFALVWTISLYARRFAGAGAVYEFIARAHGAWLGVLCGGLYFATVLVAMGLLYGVAGFLIQSFASTRLGWDPSWWPGGLVTGLFMFTLMYFGVRLSVRMQLTLTVISGIPMLVMVGAVVLSGGAEGHSIEVFHPNNHPGTGFLIGLALAVQLFIGIEAATSLGEEARDPHRTIPRAMITTVAVSGGLYLLVAYAGTIGFGAADTASEWGHNPFGVAVVADRFAGAPWGALVEAGIIVDLLAALAAFSNTLARGVFALARDGLISRRLATVSRHDTPVGGIIVAVSAGFMGLVVEIFFVTKTDMFITVALGLTTVAIVIYLILATGAFRLIQPSITPRLLVSGGVIFPLLALYGLFTPFPEGRARTSLWLALVIVLVVLAWTEATRRLRPATFERAGAHVHAH